MRTQTQVAFAKIEALSDDSGLVLLVSFKYVIFIADILRKEPAINANKNFSAQKTARN
jgi:hypothetical protein